MNNRIDEITLAKAIAICGVLLVHSTGIGIATLLTSNAHYGVYNFLSTLGRLGTPTFIMLSSFILFYVYFERDITKKLIKNFYVKRLKYIVLPYITFTLFYFIYKWKKLEMYVFADNSEVVDFLTHALIFGKGHAHLYFVVINIQFYLLFPLMLYAFKKNNILRKYAIVIGIAIQVSWILLNREFFQVEYKGSVVFTYAIFYMLGAYLGINYKSFKQKTNESKVFKWTSISFVGLGTLVGLVSYTYYNFKARTGTWVDDVQSKFGWLTLNNGFEISWAMYAGFASVLVLMVSNLINNKGDIIKKIMMKIGGTSFGIYLIHPFFLITFREYFDSTEGTLFHYEQMTIFILTFICSYLTVWIVQKIPYTNFIFGKK